MWLQDSKGMSHLLGLECMVTRPKPSMTDSIKSEQPGVRERRAGAVDRLLDASERFPSETEQQYAIVSAGPILCKGITQREPDAIAQCHVRGV